MNLDKLLVSDNLNNSIIEIDNYVEELCEYGERLEKLTEAQKTFYYNQCLEREVNNGGFNQYFYNSSGDYSHETIEALKAIGANRTSSILQKAISQFPNKLAPKDRDERIALLQQIENFANEKWDELDKEFYKYEDNLNELNIEFIKRNKNDFQFNKIGITMRFYPTAFSRSAFQKYSAELLRFGKLVQSYRALHSLFRLLEV